MQELPNLNNKLYIFLDFFLLILMPQVYQKKCWKYFLHGKIILIIF